MKNIFIIYHGRFPSEKAAALFAAQEANSFISTDTVRLLVPRRLDRVPSDPYRYFGISPAVQIIYLPTLDLFQVPLLRHVAFTVSYLVFSVVCTLYLASHAKAHDVVITNEPMPALLATFALRIVIFEVHDFPERWHGFYGMLFRRVHAVLCTNQWKQKEMHARFGVPEEKLFLERNAVDTAAFGHASKEEARTRLALPLQKQLVIYTGHLYEHKGGETLIEAAVLLPHVHFLFVGGTEHDRARVARQVTDHTNVQLVGQRPYAEMPLWQAAADVLVIPNSAREDISARYTSPMKLFEYMASERPVVASRVPSIVEVLSPDMGYLVTPDSPEALAAGIEEALTNPEEALERAKRARAYVQECSWDARAKRIAARFSRAIT